MPPSAPLKPFSDARPDEPRGLRVCVIGGGGTGAALAYDLSLRGFSVTLIEKGELTSGTTGRHHGQLHCGARYALGDRAIARECMEESFLLKLMVPQAIEYNGGIFVELEEEDRELEGSFVEACADAGIPTKVLSPREALALEGAINPSLLGAVSVPDGSFDAFRVPLSFFAAARLLGARILPWAELVGFEKPGGALTAALVLDRSSEPFRELRVEADYFLNATGAWAGSVGELAGAKVPLTPAPGTLLAVRGRLCDRVISRLHPPGDGDIAVPQRFLTILGSTQSLAEGPEFSLPREEELEFLLQSATSMLPAVSALKLHAAWRAVRPLAGSSSDAGSSRAISRDFLVLDHEESGGPAGFCTIIGGKATVLRAMAEKAADLVCSKLRVDASCRTRDFILPSWREYYRGRPA